MSYVNAPLVGSVRWADKYYSRWPPSLPASLPFPLCRSSGGRPFFRLPEHLGIRLAGRAFTQDYIRGGRTGRGRSWAEGVINRWHGRLSGIAELVLSWLWPLGGCGAGLGYVCTAPQSDEESAPRSPPAPAQTSKLIHHFHLQLLKLRKFSHVFVW